MDKIHLLKNILLKLMETVNLIQTKKILTEIIAAFNKGIANNQTEAYGNHNYENAKRKAIRLTNIYLTRAIKNGLFDEMVGDNKKIVLYQS